MSAFEKALQHLKNTVLKQKDTQVVITTLLQKYSIVPVSKIEIKNGILFIQANPMVKQVLLLHKDSIIKEINTALHITIKSIQ